MTGYQPYKIRWEFFQSVAVSTIVWLHHLDFNEILGEKARWDLCKDVVCCFEQILEAAPQQNSCTATYFLSQKPSGKTNKTSKGQLICNILPWTSTHGYTSVDQPAETYIYLLCADSRCCQDDL